MILFTLIMMVVTFVMVDNGDATLWEGLVLLMLVMIQHQISKKKSITVMVSMEKES